MLGAACRQKRRCRECVMEYLLYCPDCGKSMSVAAQHTRLTIACPHCEHLFRPAAITRLGQAGPKAVPAGRPAPIYRAMPSAAGAEPRSRVAAGLLGIFLGALGLHRFYLGYHGIGLIQFSLTVAGLLLPGPLTCCTPLVALWGFVEGVTCLLGGMRDVDGRPLAP